MLSKLKENYSALKQLQLQAEVSAGKLIQVIMGTHAQTVVVETQKSECDVKSQRNSNGVSVMAISHDKSHKLSRKCSDQAA